MDAGVVVGTDDCDKYGIVAIDAGVVVTVDDCGSSL
jgi:hypothetical protein